MSIANLGIIAIQQRVIQGYEKLVVWLMYYNNKEINIVLAQKKINQKVLCFSRKNEKERKENVHVLF